MNGPLDRVRFWNVTPAERTAAHPADRHVPEGGGHVVRAVDVEADPALVWRWVCQLQLAPYSYDLVDNLGRRSPRSLTPGAEELTLGQRFLIGPLVELDDGRAVTAATRGLAARVCGPVALSYEVVPGVGSRSRILACLATGPARGRVDRVAQELLGVGDLVMMRRQLLTLRDLAERDQRQRDRRDQQGRP
ncbi:MAG: hypothetical protein JWR42_2053 [Marmoricola sp.]|nr:hypothetical protein [Marmoricola sp.]